MDMWAAKWSQTNKLDGHKEHLCLWYPHEGKTIRLPMIFRTKRECKAYIDEQWGYIRERKDLRREPHCWRVPKPVRVQVTELLPAKPKRVRAPNGSGPRYAKNHGFEA